MSLETLAILVIAGLETIRFIDDYYIKPKKKRRPKIDRVWAQIGIDR